MRTRRGAWRTAVLPTAFLMLLPSAASANVGSAMMVAGFLHLAFLNVLIALLEAALLRFGWKRPFGPAFGWTLAANYFTAILGMAILGLVAGLLLRLLPGPVPLYKVPTVLVIIAVFSWALTVLLEWPFLRPLYRRDDRPWRRALRASLVVQTVSYLLLGAFYLSLSNLGIYREARLHHDLSFARPPLGTVYYLNPDDGSLWRVRTDGTGRSRVMDTPALPSDHLVCLFVQRNAMTGRWDLWLSPSGLDRRQRNRRLLEGFAVHCATARYRVEELHGSWLNIGQGADFRPGEEHSWEVWTGFWASEGMRVWKRGGSSYNAGLETPFVQWLCRNAAVLPNDQVVYQLGDHILLLDMPTRQVGLLAMGRGPVVTIDTPSTAGR